MRTLPPVRFLDAEKTSGRFLADHVGHLGRQETPCPEEQPTRSFSAVAFGGQWTLCDRSAGNLPGRPLACWGRGDSFSSQPIAASVVLVALAAAASANAVAGIPLPSASPFPSPVLGPLLARNGRPRATNPSLSRDPVFPLPSMGADSKDTNYMATNHQPREGSCHC